jgi:NADH-quinone oxidoreductase subunit N
MIGSFDLWLISPEICVLAMASLVLITGLFSSGRLVYVLAQLTVLGAAVFTLLQYAYPSLTAFDHMFIADKLANLSKLFIYLTTFFAFQYARKYIQQRAMPESEYYVLGLFSMLGMMVLVSAGNFLTLFLGVELLSLPLYAMVALWRHSPTGSEAAIKYFVMGALASAMLLYGFSMLYGATHSLNIANVAKAIAVMPPQQNLIVLFGLVFVVAGLVFKFGAAPFHLWVPDVYQGAPTCVTLFIGSAPKIAALAMTFRLLVDAMPHLAGQWQQLLLLVAIVSMALGNIVAISQQNLKRMLAYSAIAHMGYMSLGLLAATPNGYAAALFYMLVYAVMSMGAFGTLVLMSKAGFDAELFEDLRGLNARNPWLAFMMLVIMFSMAGIPPAVGFFAKMGVLDALIQVHLVWLAVLALLFAIIGAYYYLRVVKMMYFEEPDEVAPVVASREMWVAISLNGFLVLGLGIFPSTLIQVCRSVFAG